MANLPLQPVTWQWLEHEIASRLLRIHERPHDGEAESFVDLLEKRLQSESVARHHPQQKRRKK